ncbi:alpha/beta fold hydrolase [Corynebacterium felinum]|uniref:Carboxylic ester hydrolase n=1 Tax=Corynebacterium felinum TaxID=131318 RepID=A0ABU2B7X7_9CORY|nr:alpha/beta fold hydrolase [Corynebacterium felinum]MDF5821416.1 alpha/beta fold hydrolase [Corynebacterium felinum]MDR7353494.1 para-nitrobenzyl esterase [Corynebacterium felinum]
MHSSPMTSTNIVYATAKPFHHSVLVPKVECFRTPQTNPQGTDDEIELVLRVTSPENFTSTSDFPVVVIIHGGSYVGGSFDEPWLNGHNLPGIVTVSVEYRTGIAGFAQLHDESTFRGVADCQLALDWVQKHIEDFGGDPTNVTLMGQSAGAGIALWLARKDHFKGAFRRLLALSPAFPRTPFRRRKHILRRSLGTPITRKHLAALTYEQLAKGQRRFQRQIPFDLAFGPAPFEPAELADIPIVLSCTREEMFLWENNPLVPKWLLKRMFGVRSSWRAHGPFLGSLITDAAIRRFVLHAADSRPHNTWVMELRGSAEQPVYHCSDIPWVLNNTELLPAGIKEVIYNPDADTASVVHTIARVFFEGTLPSWPEYGEEKIGMAINYADSAVLESDFFAHLRPHLR